MDSNEFRTAAHRLIDYTINYNDTIRDRRPMPEVEPGYMRPLLPSSAPETPDSFDEIMADVEKIIMPGMTHWNSPNFHAYYPLGSSYTSNLADILIGALNCVGFTWTSSPACTELEVIMMDWLAKLLGLPSHFLSSEEGPGGGVIQGTASEATIVAVLAAKERTLRRLDDNGSGTHNKHQNMHRLVSYTSEESHCNVVRSSLIASVLMRSLPVDDKFALRGSTLKDAIEQDLKDGLVPFAVVATLGTTQTCAFDNLQEISDVLSKHPDIWLHVDAAYAGAAYVCEEHRGTMKGIERADSFSFNPHKWLLVTFDCSAMWIRNTGEVVNAFMVDPLYFRPEHHMNKDAPDYRHWQMATSRKFRSLKLWFVMRLHGKRGLQEHIRRQIGLAKEFEELVRSDQRFEVVAPVTMGLVCIRLKVTDHGDLNDLNDRLHKQINATGAIHLLPSQSAGLSYIRVGVGSRFTESSDMIFAWKEIQKQATAVLMAAAEEQAEKLTKAE
uniref:Aromatic-L-amino-acid decarboxylase n=1 Tax=Hirondellea gigas TaxID=1518452 RepID=A0A6A7G1P7_9CRUS